MSEEDSKKMLRDLVFVSLISADNDEYTEEVKQDILSRFNKAGGDINKVEDWDWVLDPLGNDKGRYVKLLQE